MVGHLLATLSARIRRVSHREERGVDCVPEAESGRREVGGTITLSRTFPRVTAFAPRSPRDTHANGVGRLAKLSPVNLRRPSRR